MAKIFVSYKFGDAGVDFLGSTYETTTARDYVDELEEGLIANNDIYKGEDDNEDLSHLSDERIAELLRDKIYDSTITIVLISKNMKEDKRDKDQWIPREISYSLSEHSRGGRTSHTNAVLAVVVPDENGDYEYFIENSNCPSCNTITYKTDLLFDVLRENMFNRKQPKRVKCSNGTCGREPHTGDDHSYIYPVKWDDFINNVDIYLDHATQLNENIDDYDIKKEIA